MTGVSPMNIFEAHVDAVRDKLGRLPIGKMKGREVKQLEPLEDQLNIAYNHFFAIAKNLSLDDLGRGVTMLHEIAQRLSSVGKSTGKIGETFRRNAGKLDQIRRELKQKQAAILHSVTMSIPIPLKNLDRGDWYVRGSADDATFYRVVDKHGSKAMEETSFFVNDDGSFQTDDGRVATTIEGLFGVDNRHAAAKNYECRQNAKTVKAFVTAGLGPKTGVFFLKTPSKLADEWECVTFHDRGVEVQKFMLSGDAIMIKDKIVPGGVSSLIGTNKVVRVPDLERARLWEDRKSAMRNVCAMGESLGERLRDLHELAATDVAGFHWLSFVSDRLGTAMTLNVYDGKGALHTFTIDQSEIDHTFILRDGSKTIGYADDASELAALARHEVHLH